MAPRIRVYALLRNCTLNRYDIIFIYIIVLLTILFYASSNGGNAQIRLFDSDSYYIILNF